MSRPSGVPTMTRLRRTSVLAALSLRRSGGDGPRRQPSSAWVIASLTRPVNGSPVVAHDPRRGQATRKAGNECLRAHLVRCSHVAVGGPRLQDAIGKSGSGVRIASLRARAARFRSGVAVLLPLHHIKDIRKLLAPIPKRLGLLAPHWNAIEAQPRVRRVRTALEEEPQRGSSFMAGLPFAPILQSAVRVIEQGCHGRRLEFDENHRLRVVTWIRRHDGARVLSAELASKALRVSHCCSVGFHGRLDVCRCGEYLHRETLRRSDPAGQAKRNRRDSRDGRRQAFISSLPVTSIVGSPVPRHQEKSAAASDLLDD